MVRNVLPPTLATQLLEDLLQRSERYVRGQWFMFGQRHDAPRTSAYFNLREAEVQHRCRGRVVQMSMCCNMHAVVELSSLPDNASDLTT